MKKMITLAAIMTIAITAHSMSYSQARNEALFLSDKMAYELNLTNAQYDAVYEINLDYLMSVNGRNDVYGPWWNRRNADLQYVLTVYQYNKYMGLGYFYRPLTWNAGNWTFNIYSRYSNRGHFYRNHPTAYASYRGGNNRNPNHYASSRPAQQNTTTRGNASASRNSSTRNRSTASVARQNNTLAHDRRGASTTARR